MLFGEGIEVSSIYGSVLERGADLERADAVGCFGSPVAKTPTIDALSIAAPQASASAASISTAEPLATLKKRPISFAITAMPWKRTTASLILYYLKRNTTTTAVS